MSRSWSQIHLAASLEARRAHSELGIDISRRINPFEALQQSGVLVVRRPLDQLSGIYMPRDMTEGGVAGVLINVSHPLSKQRFTAAHELCHHRRDQQFVLDMETEWVARGQAPTSDKERFAEAFASWFLMPRRLITSLLETLDLDPNSLDAAGVYTLSLELGTSYSATLHHLAGMNLIRESLRRQLAKVTPQSIKQMIGAIDAIEDPWKDIRLVRIPQTRKVDALSGDAVVIEVSEIPSSGYLWHPTEVPAGLSLMRDEFRPSDPSALGGDGQHRFIFRIEDFGQQSLKFDLARPWQPDSLAESIQLEVNSEPLPAPGLVDPGVLVSAGV